MCKERAARRRGKLIKVGRTDVHSALGFFWHDGHKIYLAATPEEVDVWKMHGYSDSDLHPMCELEAAFRSSSSMKFISWCNVKGSAKRGMVVPQGARSVTFDYSTHKVVLRMR